MTKTQLKLSLVLIYTLILSKAISAQGTVVVQTSILGDNFISGYILSHTDKNEIFDKVHLTTNSNTPEFISIQVPEAPSFHSLSILIRNSSSDTEYYHSAIACHTIWDNKKDTIFSLGFADRSPQKSIPAKSINVKVTVEGIGKMDDVYSLSDRQGLLDKTTQLNRENIELNIDSYNNVGRCIYLTSKKDKNYKEIVIHPESSRQFSQDFHVQYDDLKNHVSQEVLELYTNDKVYIQINANTEDGSVYNLYSSPRSLEELDGLEIDLPVNLTIVDYDVTIISRDLRSPEIGYNMVSSTQHMENIQDIVLPEIIDVSNFVTGSSLGYTVDFSDVKFDKWVLQYNIQGLAKSNVRIPWESYRSSNWFIYGNIYDEKLAVFVPVVSDDIDNDIFGDHGHLLLENDSWSFIHDFDDGHREINSYKKE